MGRYNGRWSKGGNYISTDVKARCCKGGNPTVSYKPSSVHGSFPSSVPGVAPHPPLPSSDTQTHPVLSPETVSQSVKPSVKQSIHSTIPPYAPRQFQLGKNENGLFMFPIS